MLNFNSSKNIEANLEYHSGKIVPFKTSGCERDVEIVILDT